MTDDPPHADERLDDLPPSCKYVARVLEEERELTRQALLEETGLPERTLDRALDRLQNGGYVVKARDDDDLRRTVAKLA